MKIFHFVFIFLPINGMLSGNEYMEKLEVCENLECDESDDQKVCGIRFEDETVIFKEFENECTLLKYGCRVEDNETFGVTSMKHCYNKSATEPENFDKVQFVNNCQCTEAGEPVCAIRPDGVGFRIRIFQNKCQLHRYNCDKTEKDVQFAITDSFICSNDQNFKEEEENEMIDEEESTQRTKYNPFKTKNFIVVRSMIDPRNINESIHKFFANTHNVDLRIRDMQAKLNESTRRRLVERFGPMKVFEPWTTIPKNISEDYYHMPTLNSCYHKCPTKCPDTYAPVCGEPGLDVREPRLVFLNHCYMDFAQCKMRWEGMSDTSSSAAYIENPFLFCLGEELHNMYRFLPLVRTLQRMGRLKKKGTYKVKVRDMRFFSNHPAGQLNIMG